MSDNIEGYIPIKHIQADNIPMGWEQSVLWTWNHGADIKTQYDKDTDPPSKDATIIIEIKNPFIEPRVHRFLPCGLDFIEEYVNEVINGVHDHYINPSEGKWQYTYSERIFKYAVPTIGIINQIDEVVDILKNNPYTRRAQVVTWKVWDDLGEEIVDPACLQSLWFRVVDNKLNMNIRMRSNDALKASLLNILAFTELQAVVAKRVGVEVGRYCHMADSFHIYGSYFEEMEKFVALNNTRSEEDRTFRTEQCIDSFIEGCDRLLAEKNMPSDKIPLIQERKDYWTQRSNH